ncbi:YifB family Mg chelatase-like AAA ATPase [Alistipes sp.]|uniref:YifB family Mg chelatase-like AAA ATPase n=1 Tax=Alistipes sp. TaxID=1872444 RepID=UPI003AF0D11D
MFVSVDAGAVVGIDAVRVTVEVNIAGGGLGMYLVGLPDNAVKESEQRIRAAFENSGERMSGRKVVVNLAPADLRKEGAAFDLPIAVGILAAMGRIDAEALDGTMFAGELSLDGTVKPVRGVLPMAVCARKEGLKRLVLPRENAAEAAVVDGLEVVPVGSLAATLAWLRGEAAIEPAVPAPPEPLDAARCEEDFADVKGQQHVKRALEIAAAGGHNVLLIGAPGSGKTMLARRLPSILPPLTREEALETTKIHSVAGKGGFAGGLMTRRPFRAPHHLTSQVAVVGGGQSPRPGEVSLAHNGVLFLDELPEFGRSVLEVLRQPLEDKRITVSRAKYSVEYPANFMLVAAMNPCPCGYYNHPAKECTCSPGSVQRYMNRISGPLMDRIDLHVEVTPVPAAALADAAPGEPSAAVRERVVRARAVQEERFRGAAGVHTNALMNPALLREHCRLDAASATLLERAMERLSLSARAYDRILKVARTIADLAGRERIEAADVAEAIGYRSLDRGTWGR